MLNLLRIATTIFIACITIGCHAASLPLVEEGDIIFQTSRSSQSLAIQQATQSPYSHVGIVFVRNGKPFVFEAVATVRFTPLDKWIARGEGSHFVLKRLTNATSLFTEANLNKLQLAAKQFEGKPYDLTFEWSDERIYCSELVWKLYKNSLNLEVGQLAHLKDFKLDSPAVQAKLHERYGSHIPLDEPVISPKAIFNSKLLSTVAQQ